MHFNQNIHMAIHMMIHMMIEMIAKRLYSLVFILPPTLIHTTALADAAKMRSSSQRCNYFI